MKGLKTSSILDRLACLVSDRMQIILIIISECAHLFLREEILPKMGLAIRHSLTDLGRRCPVTRPEQGLLRTYPACVKL